MKVVVDRGNFVRYGENCYKKAKEMGFDALSWAMCDVNSQWYQLPQEECDKLIEAEVEAAKKAGVEFTNCHGPWCVPWPDETEEGLLQKIEYTKRAIHNTRVSGAKYCVVHPLLPMGIEEIDDPEKTKISWEVNVKYMRELAEFAEKENVIICYENMPMLKFSLAKPRDILRVVEEVNHPNLQVCFDTGHANIYKELTIEDSTKVLAKYAKVLHVHDNFYNMDMHLLPYHGNTKWPDFSRALKEVGFDEIFELELDLSRRTPDFIHEATIKLAKDSADYIISLAYNE